MIREHRVTHNLVAAAAGLLLALWVFTHADLLCAAPDTLIRFTLTGCFALLILLRPKPEHALPALPLALVLTAGLLGVALHTVGIVFVVHQLEWIGLLAVVGACLARALPPHSARDALKALFLLYWAHPLPSQLLGGFQITMQQLSVTGAEWLLHTLNVRVWADGLVLKSGPHIYEVPVWCSGMRTATTVFLLAIGLGVVKRLALHQKVLAVAAALLQAIALNVVRISAMVLLVPQLNAVSSVDFLHNTTGVVVIAAVFLVYLEMEIMRRTKHRTDRRAGELNPDLADILNEHPPFWRRVVNHPGGIATVLIILLIVGFLGNKHRPSHRTAMYRGVAEALRDGGHLADAERLGWEVYAMAPHDIAWESAMLRLLVMRGKYSEALDRLAMLPPDEGQHEVERRILSAYSLMGLQQHEQARALIEELPAPVRDEDPRVAMILAEMAYHADSPAEVAQRVITAAQWGPNIRRIRALYPYLRLSREWTAISETDPRTAYPDPVQALSAAEAFMNLNRVMDVASLTRRAVDTWPHDPRLLAPLFYLTGKRPDGGWEPHYAAHLRGCLPTMQDPDVLYALTHNTFQLLRPDLAWSIYDRINTIDPTYPGLAMMAVRYGSKWFDFRRRFLGVPAGHAWESINLKAYYHVGLLTPMWDYVCRTVPLGDTLSVVDVVSVRKRLLKEVLLQFNALAEQDTLSLAMRYEYAFAREIDKDLDGARTLLAAIADDYPAQTETARIELSAMYERKGDWQNIYETLRTYLDTNDKPQLGVLMRLATAQHNLHLGLGALHTARQCLHHFPESPEAAGVLSMVLRAYDSPEAALRVISSERLRHHRVLDVMQAEALSQTQRFTEFRRFTKSALVNVPPISPETPQVYALPSAELALNWHLLFVPSQAEFASHATRIRNNQPRTSSPFLRDLYTIWLACYANDAPGSLLTPASWMACGRDATERSIALNQLILILCQRQAFDAARTAAEAATTNQPEMAIHWRFRIGLSGADPAVVNEARMHCPADSEIWLAALLNHCRAGLATPKAPPPQPDLVHDVEAAIASNSFPPATLTRAAELLLRAGYQDLAIQLARHTSDIARSLLPAHIIGLRCAILAGDRTWAEACTLEALGASLHPPPELYRKLVQIKIEDSELDIDDDMVAALKNLRRSDPDNVVWARMLSFVRFKRGGWEVLDSLNQANAALAGGATDRATYMIGAEAARLLQNSDRATDLLRQGLERYPNDPAMLNNLAYTLANTPSRVAEALELIPLLLPRTSSAPWLIDTIALVYLRNDKLKEAEQALGWAATPPPEGSVEWFRHQLRKAEIAFRRDELQKTISLIRTILTGSKRIPDEEIMTANRLLSKADEALRQLGQKPERTGGAGGE
ncbi:MAG: archaeosortase/exosortase family protein [Verrucomicrobia bacterium]|jgi:exosortase/archaeosortase family protein|nr:archaeosortase/exosortase family protein [Verrucomicrobiota bacterium]MBT7065186.1 archaeosortase/exosortase family protein [Verrucomicrobiota bacterium]MBT7700356.1 archaeosortase/exosortase family protein [Verrucomicrobiota bacterium]